MVDTAAVTVIDGGDELLEIDSRHVFFKPTLSDFREQLASTDEFHGEVDLGFARQNFVELDYVWMPYHLHHRDFSLDMLHHTHLDHFLFVHNLQRILLGLCSCWVLLFLLGLNLFLIFFFFDESF